MQVHPSQISPGENFDIFYFLRNHTDGSTYYVRAKIYDVRTGDVLQTTDLTQSPNNTRLYAKTIQAPANSTGIGRNIVAIATVYTDSGYSTKSTDYEEQEQYFLVRAMLPQIVGGGGGVDHDTLREVVAEELEKAIGTLPKPGTPKDFPDMPFDSVFGALGKVQSELDRVPKDAPDLAPVRKAIAAVLKAIEALPKPTEPVDLSPVTDALDSIAASLDALQEDLRSFQQEQARTLVTEAKTQINSLGKALEEKLVVGVIEAQEFSFPVQRKVNKPEPAQPQPLDVSHLM